MMSTNFPDIYPYSNELRPDLKMGVAKMVPTGICIHYLADRNVKRAIQGLQNNQNLGYHLIIDRDGKTTQTTYFNLSVNHAGKAMWIKASPNRSFIAISLASWGLLNDQKEAWNGSLISDAVLKEYKGKKYWWDPATTAQERELTRLLDWIVLHGIKPDMICGHDECALPEGRKVDPGMILTKSMGEIRHDLQERSKKTATKIV